MSITFRRSKLSAKTPASNEKIMMGSVTDDCTSATMLCDSVSDVIIQAAPTAWTSPPKFEARAAIQSTRKVWFRKSASVDVLCGTRRSFPLPDLFLIDTVVEWLGQPCAHCPIEITKFAFASKADHHNGRSEGLQSTLADHPTRSIAEASASQPSPRFSATSAPPPILVPSLGRCNLCGLRSAYLTGQASTLTVRHLPQVSTLSGRLY